MRYLLVCFLCFIFSTIFSQYKISGTVTNNRGEKLFFTTVFLEGTSYAAISDEKGDFEMTGIPRGQYSLKASFIGYKSYISQVNINKNIVINIVLSGEIFNLDQVEIQANRVGQKAPFTSQDLNKTQLQKENLGQDVPFILQWSPSMIVTSDAGAGIGYTGLRLRGSDQTRINVTINGVPLNDAESQNVFWVDLPDLMGSVKNIQIQRGVGTSTNGAGAFGGTVSINTNDIRVNSYLDVAGTLGAFNTKKLSVNLGTGLINNRYFVDGRYSVIRSDGYVDRATSDLSSFSFTAARVTAKSSLKLNILSGKEVTYQSWYGVPEAKINGDKDALLDHFNTNYGSLYLSSQDSVNLFSSDRRYNFYTYPNQIDKYRQTHVQLIHSLVVNPKLKTKMTLFYTRGKGYFEEFKYNDQLENYGLNSVIDTLGNEIRNADIVRRRWLSNHLVGLLADVEYKVNPSWTLQSGVSGNTYIGDHFGHVIKSSLPDLELDLERKYYENRGMKTDLSSYARVIYDYNQKLALHFDMQYRYVNYSVAGIDNDLRLIDVEKSYHFFNPKVGFHYLINPKNDLYLSLAIANKEPSRGDFIDNAFNTVPKSEHLQNWELGYRYKSPDTKIESNVYYMQYLDQLVLTGELNDVGAPVRVNVPESFRLGIENSITQQVGKKLLFHINATLSTNKITAFEEVIADYTEGFERFVIRHEDTDISFSPSFTGAFQLQYQPINNLEASWSTKYVSRQYLDNTSNSKRALPAYSYQNIRITYSIINKYLKNLECTLMVNNLLNQQYSSNGYTYSYIYENLITENFLYPQAGIHMMLGVKFGL